MAPEILSTSLRNRGYEGKPTDIWSLGIILATLLIGSFTFSLLLLSLRRIERQ